MPFVNEYIPPDDFKRFDFEALNRRMKETSGTTPSDAWTIDRGEDVWLRCFYFENDHTHPQGGFTGVSVWDFYWHGTLLQSKVQSLEAGGEYGKHCWGRKKLLSIDIPANLEGSRLSILKDLESAFTAYRDGGVFASAASYSFVLEV